MPSVVCLGLMLKMAASKLSKPGLYISKPKLNLIVNRLLFKTMSERSNDTDPADSNDSNDFCLGF